MKSSGPKLSGSSTRALASLTLAALAAVGVTAFTATPAAAAADVGYVRLAHLSPDTPEVDVYLSSVTGKVKEQVFKGVGYGVVSAYLPLPVGTYTVAMRVKGDPVSTPPVIAAAVTVERDQAYTVAGVGPNADLGLRVIDDDLTKPPQGQARVRVVHASAKAARLKVTRANGAMIAEDVSFATTTEYVDVPAGEWTCRLQPLPSGSATDVAVSLDSGSIYSLFVLDGAKNALTAELRTDSQDGLTPVGGVETGAGGTAGGGPGVLTYLWLVAGGAVLVALIALVRLSRTSRARR